MNAKRRGPHQISEIANDLIDPLLARRSGINTMLIGAWEDIAGADFAHCTRPEKISWPRRHEADRMEPGTLTVACEGAQALFLMHAKGELIQRVNAFFGFPAIGQLRIVQKPVAVTPARPKSAPRLDALRQKRLETLLAEIEDGRLKQALARLGAGVLTKKSGR